MGKFLADKFYTFLSIVAIYFVFNILLRDKLINWIFNTSNEKSVTDANLYAQETLVRNIFSYCLLVLLISVAVISVILLTIKEGKDISKVVLISVLILVVLCFFLGLISGSFN